MPLGKAFCLEHKKKHMCRFYKVHGSTLKEYSTKKYHFGKILTCGLFIPTHSITAGDVNAKADSVRIYNPKSTWSVRTEIITDHIICNKDLSDKVFDTNVYSIVMKLNLTTI
jgi:hypothetical protein